VAEPLQSREQSSKSPLVTVAMPVYNAGTYLRLAVLSIVKQSFTDWELLIVDDGSTDNALQSISDINDVRIHISCDGKNKGLAARLNECIDLARGKYLARMDQDDVSYPERFMRQLELLQKNPFLDLVATRTITIDAHNEATGIFPGSLAHDEICSKPWLGFHFPHPTWLGRIKWFREHRYSIPGPYYCEDQELLLRSYRESRFATVDEILFGYRVRGTINWQKLLKTRWTVLHVQLRQFTSSNQWHFMLLSISVFAAKMTGDLLKMVSLGLFQNRRLREDDAVVLQWNRVLSDLAVESKEP
jgi:glycosyltransferase involved in cell wall biosynthesis